MIPLLFSPNFPLYLIWFCLLAILLLLIFLIYFSYLIFHYHDQLFQHYRALLCSPNSRTLRTWWLLRPPIVSQSYTGRGSPESVVNTNAGGSRKPDSRLGLWLSISLSIHSLCSDLEGRNRWTDGERSDPWSLIHFNSPLLTFILYCFQDPDIWLLLIASDFLICGKAGF